MARTILLGHILGAHGIRGEVLIRVYSDDPQAIRRYGTVRNAEGTVAFKVLRAKPSSKGTIVAFEGIDTRDAAEALRGLALHVPREALPPPDAREFYHADLIGLRAERLDGSALGEVVAVANFGAGDLLEIRMPGRKGTEYVLFNDLFVPTVDIDTGRVVIDMPQLDRPEADHDDA